MRKSQLCGENRPPCYIEEKTNSAYPLCAGRGFANCAHCGLWADFEEGQDESQVNRPLTPEKLRWMDGEPVWITGEKFRPRWDLIRRVTTSGMSAYTLGFLSWEDCGKTWRAYRHKLGPSTNERRKMMERLTIRNKGVAFWTDSRCPGGAYRRDNDLEDQRRLDRLAAYEDTGLEPGEIKNLKSRALMGALETPEMEEYSGSALERADRLIAEYESIGPIGHLWELAQAEKDGRLVELPVKIGDKIYHLFDGEIQNLLVSNVIYRAIGGDACRIIVECIPFHRCYWREDFDKTVFLTREEAEAALKKREEAAQ